MSRWFRHYAGMMRDEKLVRVAVKSKQSVERVVWVWGAILESAAEINDGGRYEFDAGEAAYFLRCDDAELGNILDCLEGLGRVNQGVVVKWSDRQYASDTSAERQRRYRERKQANAAVHEDDAHDERHGDGQVTSRDGDVTPQETETETEVSDANASSSPEPAKAAPVASSPVVSELPCTSGQSFQITEADVAEWRASFPAVDVLQQIGAMRSWLNAHPDRRKTLKGARKFIVGWLDRRQNDSGRTPPAFASKPHATASPLRGPTAASIWTDEAFNQGMMTDDEPPIIPGRHEIARQASGPDRGPGAAWDITLPAYRSGH